MVDTITAPVGQRNYSTGTVPLNARPDVLTVQRLLNAAHTRQHVPRHALAEDGAIGPHTIRAIAEFQQAIFGWHDGVVQPNQSTLRRLNEIKYGSGPPVPVVPPRPASALAEQAVLIGLTQDGVREQPLGSNDGPQVREYLRSVGLDEPAFWCMAFVYWCFNQAAAQVGGGNPLKRTASCSAMYAWAHGSGHLVTHPQRGDIFLLRGGEAGRTHQHTGIVTALDGSQIATVEGNTNNDHSRNGIGVFRLSRGLHNLDFVRV